MAQRGCSFVTALALVIGTSTWPLDATNQTNAPRLRYEPPADLYHSALRPPDNYESTRTNASLQVYPFRPAPADVMVRFRQTLLRDWIASQYQEARLTAPPTFGPLKIQGAEAAAWAQFAEVTSFGTATPRLRILIVASGSAALIDARAASQQAWPIALQSFNALIGTLRVETASSAGAVTAESRAFAGLYVGTKPKFVSGIGPGVAAGSGTFVPALHLYLFSEDGRVYRAYDEIRAPGGDIRRFDFDAAEQADPVNSGRYVIRGDQLTITLGERREETIVVTLRQPGRLTISTVDYTRRAAPKGTSFVSHRVDRLETCGFSRGVQAEDQSDGARDDERQDEGAH
jgi:hypothetical protein